VASGAPEQRQQAIDLVATLPVYQQGQVFIGPRGCCRRAGR
jgi:hypothetical protein